ncbi:Phosphoglycerate kinase [Mycoplasmopsis californica]|uniref:Phosphoglycerate kinase n=1 Tax=Mycoplasmopsis equigenitalium TaxID=114883 RepID=A0ABY5J459_9BACT|nr:phosphoglycerate kinase [Mycoplasmopsis equigenitalium]UUD37301.1 phosphoglycerate kinase [Mycoplasmopsis equigenitalium]VEU69389.1 Phosphoglycerate kinase [Mycoplasmopsis californica]
MKKFIDDVQLKDKKVLLRVDFNVPMKDGKITSLKRIKAALPTIKKIISEGGKAILFSHLGRIKTEEDKAKKNIAPVAEALASELKKPVKFVNATRGDELEKAIAGMKSGDVLLFQNTRYEDLNEKAESKNNAELGKYWASLGDVFINDAFGTAHRAHASNVGIASNIKVSALGYLMNKEVEALSKIANKPEHPYVAIIGGAKVSDKIGILESLVTKVDKLLIGGAMAYTFLKAQGVKIGTSLLEEDKLEYAKSFLDKYASKVVLPIDHAVAKEFADVKAEVSGKDIKDGFMGLDLGPKSIELFKKALHGAKSVFWNGPMGVSEFENFKKGTFEIAQAISELKGVYSVVGGGDSVAAIEKLKFEDKFSHVSTGGGASLELLEGKVLPGVESIQNK